jgi:hypothetical protein
MHRVREMNLIMRTERLPVLTNALQQKVLGGYPRNLALCVSTLEDIGANVMLVCIGPL